MTTFYFALIFIAQIVVIVYYALYPVTEYKHFLQSLFPTKKHLALVNGACAVSIFSVNKIGQFVLAESREVANIFGVWSICNTLKRGPSVFLSFFLISSLKLYIT